MRSDLARYGELNVLLHEYEVQLMQLKGPQ